MSSPRKNRRKFWFFLPLAVLLAVALWAWRPWQRPITIVESVNPTDGAAMVWVPAGTFRMGSGLREGIRAAAGRRDWREMRDVVWNGLRGEADSDEEPARKVFLDGYWIYQYEVTVAQYRQFCAATGRPMPPEPPWDWQDNHPVVNVDWDDAAAYAAWAGAALPTEAQWEKAARGPDGRLYPWGNAWDGTKCRNSVDQYNATSSSPVGIFPASAGPYGAHDMAGNVWEWCADWYDGEYYKLAPPRNPTGPATGTARVVRGGSWLNTNPVNFRAASRCGGNPSYWLDSLGFRCVLASPGP